MSTKRAMEGLITDCKTISEGKFKDSLPEMKQKISLLGGSMKIALEGLLAAREEMSEVKRDVADLKELKPLVEEMGQKVTNLGAQVSGIGEQMSGLNTNIEKLQKKMDEKHENVDKSMGITVAALEDIGIKMDEEKEVRERERQKREEEQLNYDRSLVAPCLILYGLDQEAGESAAALHNKVGNVFYNVLELREEEVVIEKVMRFGKPGTTAGASARPPRPALVRVVLASPVMKGPLFKSLIKLKGKDEYKGLSIQNEVPRFQMGEHKAAVERAKSIRTDTGCRTRIKFGKGPVTLTIQYNGKWMDEEEFSENRNTGTVNRNVNGNINGNVNGNVNGNGNHNSSWAEESGQLG